MRTEPRRRLELQFREHGGRQHVEALARRRCSNRVAARRRVPPPARCRSSAPSGPSPSRIAARISVDRCSISRISAGGKSTHHMHERKDAGHERGIGEGFIRWPHDARREFHETRARADQLHERIRAPRQMAAVRVKQQLRPAQSGGCRSPRWPRATTTPPARLNALELARRSNCTTMSGLSFSSASSSRMPGSPTARAKSRSSALRAGFARRADEHLRPREEIALKEVEAELAASSKSSMRLDLFRDQQLAMLFERRREFGQMGAIGGQKIDLHDIHVRQRGEQRHRRAARRRRERSESPRARNCAQRLKSESSKVTFSSSSSTKRSGCMMWTMSSNSRSRLMFT